MDDMGDACHGALDAFAIRDITFDNFHPVGFRKQAVVTQGPNFCAAPAWLGEDVGDQVCADLAGGACYQKQHGILPIPIEQARQSCVRPAGIPP